MERLTAVEREIRYTIPYFARLVVFVDDEWGYPDVENRRVSQILYGGSTWELDGAAVAEQIAFYRDDKWDYLVLHADMNPWLARHPDLLEYLDDNFRRVATDEQACLIYALQPDPADMPETGEDGLPIPPSELIAVTVGRLAPADFYASGMQARTWISEMLARNGVAVADLRSVLDFGCGAGRVIRHWPVVTEARLHGSDYNPRLISWCSENLTFGEFRTNDLEPSLDFADESMDFVYSLSIFTHLDEPIQVPWVEEITRVLRPGGELLITLHGRERLLQDVQSMKNMSGVAAAFEAGELAVVRSEQSGSSACTVWHPQRYVREVLAEGLELLEYAPSGALDMEQDAVLLRKPAA
jgi:SAM-dependent methyltransferase